MPEPFVACEGGAWVEKPGVPADDCGGTTQPTTGSSTGTTTTTDATGTPGTTTSTAGSTTTAGSSSGSTGGGVACDPNNLPEVGSPCDTEGEFCSQGACNDPCQFCNTLRCEGGVWTQLEAPPAPCADCEEICPPTVAAMCPAGPPDQQACVSGCMDIMGGPCGLAYSQVRACVGPMPTFTCDMVGRPTVIGCESQFTELYECLGI